MKKIYLIDVSAMFFRAYYAIRPLTSSTGVPVNAVYGFLSMITKLMKEEKPDYMVFCYDRKEPSFRKDLYNDYKANRTEMPEDLAVQIPYIKKLASIMGIPTLEVPGYEADDLIGTMVHIAREHDLEAVIVSGDKDFSQLIKDHVVLFDTMKDVRYDSQGVFDKWGVRPDQFIDYLAIVGDTSDNVPGVKGIGEKGALKLLQQFSTLEDIYARIDEVESKSIKQKLIDSKEMAFLSKELVTIVTSVPLERNLEVYHVKAVNTEELRALLRELNFKTFEKTLLGDASPAGASGSVNSSSAPGSAVGVSTATTPVIPVNIETPEFFMVSLEQLQANLPVEKAAKSVADLAVMLKPQKTIWGFFDSKTIYLGIDFSVFTIDTSEGGFEGPLRDLGALTDQLQIQWKGFDLKNFWHQIGAQTPIGKWDAMLAAYSVKAENTSDIRKIFLRECNLTLPEALSAGQWIKALSLLEEALQKKLIQFNATEVYQKFELPLAASLLKMENRGIRIDVPMLKEYSEALGTDIQRLEKEIHQAAGEEFNVASPKQLGVILFEKLGLEATKKTKTGYSTDNEVLEAIGHPIAKLVLEYRELAKLKSTYVDSLPELIDEKTGRVHTSFNQALTSTGRLSSTHPNLQNIPIRTARGQMVRKAFIADEGKQLLSVDYSQIELRILAHISEDPGLCRAFADDLDIHAATAAEIYGVSLKDVTSDLRRAAKAVNFGIAYGQGAFGLAENLGISRTEAKDIIERYFTRFKNVREYIDSTVKLAHEKGYVETLFGRRRYIDELNSKNVALKKFGERAAINAPIQGTAADLVKLAMIEVDKAISLPMLLQVHDELIFEDTKENLEAQAPALVKILEGVASLKVPLKVNYAIGFNWDEAH